MSPRRLANARPTLSTEEESEYEIPQGRFDSWERVDWIIAASRLIGIAVIVFGLASVINVAINSRGAIGTPWVQFASFAASSVSTGLLLIVAAEILDHLLSKDDS